MLVIIAQCVVDLSQRQRRIIGYDLLRRIT